MSDRDDLQAIVDAIIPLAVPAPFQAMARSQAAARMQQMDCTEALRRIRLILSRHHPAAGPPRK